MTDNLPPDPAVAPKPPASTVGQADFREVRQQADYRELPTSYKPPPDPASTRHTIALYLILLLAGTIILHHVGLILVAWLVCDAAREQKYVECLSDIFGKCLPAEVGLLGAASAFYFSAERRS